MSTVLAFKVRPHIRIESGRVTRSDDPDLIGRWCHFVSFVDEDGYGFKDYVGPSRQAAEDAAAAWAVEAGLKVIDTSEEEPRA